MKKNKYKERVFMVFFMFGLTTFFVLIISLAHLSTKNIVKRNESLFVKKSILFTAAIRVTGDPQDITESYKKYVTEQKEDGKIIYYIVQNNEKKKSYVIPAIGAGLWGAIESFVGIKEDLSTITGIDFTKQSETPGLGARISEDWFREQFRGKKGPFKIVAEGSDDKEDEFDAITGATVTTKAVQSIVNSTIKKVPQLIGGKSK